jgi:glycosyltransferase involved in cell wall biosynthesis
MRANLISWGVPPEKIIYIPNGVDPDRFISPDPLRVEIKRNELNLTGKKVVAYIGSLSMPSHPVNLLVEAFAQLQQDIQGAVLMIVGGGEQLANLQKQVIRLGIEEVTRFVGRVHPEDIPLYYALADVSIDPVYDNPAARGRSPLKLIESWICGVPFVSADVGERANLMGDPPAGVLVPPNQTDELSKGILKILKNPEIAAKYVQRGQERVQQYHWQTLAQKLEDGLLKQSP